MSNRRFLCLQMAIGATAMLALGGCASPWGANIDRNAVACQGYGFYPETPEYAECMKFVESREAKRAALSGNPQPIPQKPDIVCQTNSSGTSCQSR
jgi:hypothetical protein